MFVRRFFYDKASGNVVMTEHMQGDILVRSVEELYATSARLAGRSPADTGLFEWREPIETIETLFASKIVSIDITQTPPALVWTDPPVEPDETEATV